MKYFNSITSAIADAWELFVLPIAFAAVVLTLGIACAQRAHGGDIPNLFDAPFSAERSGVRGQEPGKAPVDLFSLPDALPSAIGPQHIHDLFALNDEADPPKPPAAKPDTRPVVYAYGIDNCPPCLMSEQNTGPGDARVRVEWRHSEDGETHPWHIHDFARKHGYPVYHYPDAHGKWKQTAGAKTLDELAKLVRRDKPAPTPKALVSETADSSD